MSKTLTEMSLDLTMLVGGFAPPVMPMLTPHKNDTEHDAKFLAILTELEKKHEAIRKELAAQYIAAVCPYRVEQVLDVDTAWVGRKRLYYKGAWRFLVKWIRPFYWTHEDGKLYRLFINLYGCYLSEAGDVLRPTLQAGIPLRPGEWQPERIGLNVSGHASTILGVSANQSHGFNEFEALAAREEAARG